MTTPPLHNTDEQRADKILDSICWGDYQVEGGSWGHGVANRPEARSAILSLLAEAREEGVMMGAAGELDVLWENSYYRTGPDTSKQIEERMIMLFGKDWTADIYVHIDKLTALRQKESK